AFSRSRIISVWKANGNRFRGRPVTSQACQLSKLTVWHPASSGVAGACSRALALLPALWPGRLLLFWISKGVLIMRVASGAGWARVASAHRSWEHPQQRAAESPLVRPSSANTREQDSDPPRQQKQRVSAPFPKKGKTQKASVETRCRSLWGWLLKLKLCVSIIMYGCYKMQTVLAVPPCGHRQLGRSKAVFIRKKPDNYRLRFLNCQSAGYRLRPALEARTLSCESCGCPPSVMALNLRYNTRRKATKPALSDCAS